MVKEIKARAERSINWTDMV